MMKLFAGVLAVAVWASAATAEISNDMISAYNLAVQKGDKDAQIAAAQNLAAEAMANPEDENAALLAYEAAWTLCKNDSCEAATAPAEFARLQPASDPAAHPVAADRELLAAYTEWKTRKSRGTRQRFDAALTAVATGDPSMLSLSAFLARYSYDTNRGNFRRAANTAREAATHFKLVESQFPYLFVSAEISAIAASFNNRPNADAQRQMAHLEGRLLQLRNTYEEEQDPDWLKQNYYRASAWSLAMEAYFLSTGERGVPKAETDGILASYATHEDKSGAGDHDGAKVAPPAMPFCQGSLDMTPRMRYPRGGASKGMFGAVIVGFSIEEGQVRNAEILASVPSEGFREVALSTVSQWTWEVSREQPVEPCTNSRDNFIQPLVFALH